MPAHTHYRHFSRTALEWLAACRNTATGPGARSGVAILHKLTYLFLSVGQSDGREGRSSVAESETQTLVIRIHYHISYQ